MGVIVAVLGMALAGGDAAAALPLAFYAAHHTLVKGGLFLAVGAARMGSGRRLWPVLLPAAVLALGMAGLPFTGGFLAKLAVKPLLGSGIVGTLGALSTAGTALLMIHFLRRLAAEPAVPGPARGRRPWLAAAVIAVVVPWVLEESIMGSGASVLAPAALWDALWPILLGGLLWVGLWRLRDALPRVPDGDIAVLMEKDAMRLAAAAGAAMERLDRALRQWPAAVAALLAAAIALAVMMAA
jgi:formate hydrogenlyase subunit 3/multisubunit Na+/H+ antiporter MnhD subunit